MPHHPVIVGQQDRNRTQGFPPAQVLVRDRILVSYLSTRRLDCSLRRYAGWGGQGHRYSDPHQGALIDATVDLDLATEEPHALLDAQQPEAGTAVPFSVLLAIKSASVILHLEPHVLLPSRYLQPGLMNIRVLDHIEQQFLRDSKEKHSQRLAAVTRRTGHLDTHLQSIA